MKHQPIKSEYRTRITECDQCDNGLTYYADGAGYVAETCESCGGTFEMEAICPGCERAEPLNAEGYCRDCTVPAILDVQATERGIWL